MKVILAFLPINYWKWHLKVTNFYIETHRKEYLTGRNVSINKIKDIHIQEVMTFYAFLIQMAVKPHPGARYTECWSEQNKVWYTTCKKCQGNDLMKSALLFIGVKTNHNMSLKMS